MAGPTFCCMFLVLMTIVQLDCVTGNMQDPQVTSLRLRGGRTTNEGRVEIQLNNQRRWFVVCEKGWDNKDASAACRQLRYPDGGSKIKTNDIGNGTRHFFQRKFVCNELKTDDFVLSDCSTEQIRYSKRCRKAKDKAAKVRCNGNRLSTTTSTTTTTTLLASSGPGHNQTVGLNKTDETMYNTTAVTTTTMGTVTWTDEPTTTLEDATTQGQVDNAQSSTTAGKNGQSPSSQKQSQPFPVVTVAAAVGTVLGILLLLAVLLCCYCRRRARNQEDNMTSKLKEDTDQVGMGELAMGKAQHDDSENTYNTIQDPAVNSKGLPVIPTAPPSEHDVNYSTIPDLQSPPTGGRVDERAPAPPPNQTNVYYSTVRDNGTTSTADKTGTPVTVKTTQEPEYAVVKKESKRKENKKEESDKGTAAPGPEYAVVNKVPKTGGKGESQYGTVDNVIYEPY